MPDRLNIYGETYRNTSGHLLVYCGRSYYALKPRAWCVLFLPDQIDGVEVWQVEPRLMDVAQLQADIARGALRSHQASLILPRWASKLMTRDAVTVKAVAA